MVWWADHPESQPSFSPKLWPRIQPQMGNRSSVHILSESEETVPVIRYTVASTVRYKGTTKTYIYVSKEFGLEIYPFQSSNPVAAYNEEHFKGCDNERATVQIKRTVMEACQEFLRAREIILNEVQTHFAVS
jgi:hypothetical protein